MLSSSSRLLLVLSLLQTRSHWAGSELAERLKVHPRTLRRDIDRLRELGYPIHASSGVAGGYAFRAGQALPPLLLDDDEALAVAIALRIAASGSVSGVEESSLRAMVKLEQVMPARLRRRTDALRSAILPVEGRGPTVDAGVLAILAGACRDQLRLDFAYEDGRGQGTSRRVDPQGLVHTGSRWYLVAWDLARSDWRSFRVDRIVAAPVTGPHFPPRPGPDGGDLRAYVARSVGVSPYSVQARIILHQPYAAMARRIPHSAGMLEAIDGERCLFQCGANELDSLVSWLVALDVEFDVVEPPALVDRLREAGERLSRSLARQAPLAAPAVQRAGRGRGRASRGGPG
jgi:predicted DNA-binding transcriptional regulator YafY